MDFIRYMMTRIFGVHWAQLTMHDQTRIVRRVRFRGGRAMVIEHVCLHYAYLKDGGRLETNGLGRSWEPYEPFAPRRWPTPPASYSASLQGADILTPKRQGRDRLENHLH